MGFKENLKSELIYSGILVKELSSITGIKKHTLDNYLNTHNSIPSADNAVKIARALGVTTEYLVTGIDSKFEKIKPPLHPEIRLLAEIAGKLSQKNRLFAIKFLKLLAEQEE